MIIDEVHNIRSSAKEQKDTINNLTELVKQSENMKFLLLSATPMFDDYKEIIFLLNLIAFQPFTPVFLPNFSACALPSFVRFVYILPS